MQGKGKQMGVDTTERKNDEMATGNVIQQSSVVSTKNVSKDRPCVLCGSDIVDKFRVNNARAKYCSKRCRTLSNKNSMDLVCPLILLLALLVP